MDGRHVGSVLRAARMQLRLRQADVADLARVSQSRVSEAELGRLDGMSLRVLDAIAAALDVRLRVDAWWRGTDAHKLLDRSHASIVEAVIRELVAFGWIVIPEYTFNHYGERGSVDIVAWMPLTRSLLIVEIKSSIVDLQELFAALARKVRIVPGLLRTERGWSAASVSKLVVLPGTTANRSVVARHKGRIAAALPAQRREIRRWLRDPSGPIAGVWFVSPTRVTVTKQAVRVRKTRSRPIAGSSVRESLDRRGKEAGSTALNVPTTRQTGR